MLFDLLVAAVTANAAIESAVGRSPSGPLARGNADHPQFLGLTSCVSAKRSMTAIDERIMMKAIQHRKAPYVERE